MTREEAINLIGWLKSKTNRDDDLEAIDMAIEALQADRQHGEWIYKTNDECVCEEWECSKCGDWNFVKTDFCPHCGAIMEGSAE